MNEKIFNEQGVLTAEGIKATEILKLEIEKLLNQESIADIQTVGCILQKIIGDAVNSAIQKQTEERNELAAMSDEEFDSFLVTKYTPIYGEHWFLKAGLTPEELDRVGERAKRSLDKALKEKENSLPTNGIRISPRGFRGRGEYID